MMRLFFALVAVLFCIRAEAQPNDRKLVVVKPSKGTVCYAGTKNAFTTIPSTRSRFGSARTMATANIEVTYDGFTPQAKAAFQEAVDIWESLLETNVTIHIEAHWAPLGPGVLGSAGPGTYLANFEGAPKQNVLYPIALAEKIADEELNNANEPDIVATFNSTNEAWHFGLTGNEPPEGKYDLVSIVLHEIGHGLGITHAYSVENGLGVLPEFYGNKPVVYETSLRTIEGNNLVNSYTPPSGELANVITGELFYTSPLVASAKVYTPASYSPGSSIAHLDENTYPPGSANSLMTPFIDGAERILDPGPIAKNILKDIGWIVTRLEHTPLPSTENAAGPFHAVVKILNTNGYDAGSVKINPLIDGNRTSAMMTPTGNANEYSFDLPVGNNRYDYFISVEDNDGRKFTTPSVYIQPGVQPIYTDYGFFAGPDTEPPYISHAPPAFFTTTENINIEAVVIDPYGVDHVKLEWQINNVAQPDATMTPAEGGYYRVSINAQSQLQPDDVVKYRIRAEDSSVAGNVRYSPDAISYYQVNVVGLGETKTFYTNNFDDGSTADFFGSGFTVTTPLGFASAAINSDHPYAAGGSEDAHIDLIYNLKIPITITEDPDNAILKFDEIVLVEPGEEGSVWPGSDFFDYVVVEGSRDGGITWIALAEGYDSRYDASWLAKWTSGTNSGNSTSVGTPSLYRTHTFNLHDKFEAGEDVAFRFRLYSDPFSTGWGWAIDNLKIQIDDIPPTILHKHVDFVLDTAKAIVLNVKVPDRALETVSIDYRINGGDISNAEIVVTPGVEDYTQTFLLADFGLKAYDVFEYRFNAADTSGNAASFPSTDFIKTSIISWDSPDNWTEFNFSSVDDVLNIASNFFEVQTPKAFTNPAFSTNHPYDSGRGPGFVSDYSWVPMKATTVSADNAILYYEDVALIEYSGEGVKDYVVVEASKDGITWSNLIEPYAANLNSLWKATFDSNKPGSQGLYQQHFVDITGSGTFKVGDVILIRFRLHSDSSGTGWGWAVDNISIQGAITGVEPELSTSFEAWPNPVSNGSFNLSVSIPSASEVSVEILSTQGQLLSAERFFASTGATNRVYDASAWADGFYVVKVRSAFGTAVKKIIKLNSQN